MAIVTIRNLNDRVKMQLRVRAAKHGRSMEEEIREILAASVADEGESGGDVYQKIRQIVEPLGGIDLELAPRELAPDPPRFQETTRDRARYKRPRRNG